VFNFPGCGEVELEEPGEQWAREVCVAASNGSLKDISFVHGNGFETKTLRPDDRTGIQIPGGGYFDNWGYQYNEILLSNRLSAELA
jgi:hypothetical protein